MKGSVKIVLSAFMALTVASSLSAQENYLQAELDNGSTPPFQIGLFGFASRVGIDFEGQGQAVASFALDLGDLYTDRLRLRPSAELGFGWGDNTYVANVEVIYRFTPDTMVAVPYVGGGIGLAGQEGCGSVDGCPAVWGQFVLGFELKLRNRLSWLIEYHGEDSFGRQRLLVGLTTRRGI